MCMCGQGGGGRGGGRERSARDPWDSEMCSMENKATAEPRCRKAGPRDARASLQIRTGGSRRRPWRLPGTPRGPSTFGEVRAGRGGGRRHRIAERRRLPHCLWRGGHGPGHPRRHSLAATCTRAPASWVLIPARPLVLCETWSSVTKLFTRSCPQLWNGTVTAPPRVGHLEPCLALGPVSEIISYY